MKLLFSLLITFLMPIMSMAESTDRWALINIPVACIRDGKGHSTEMISQAIMGTPMRVIDNDGEWFLLEGPDRYRGYVNISSLHFLNNDEMNRWRDSDRLVSVSMPELKVFTDTIKASPRNFVTELVCGSIVSGKLGEGDYTFITLPDGRSGWVLTEGMSEISRWASLPFDADAILDRCYYLMGTPYLWGACSTKSVDCSGLVRVAYYAGGILTLRDAREQINIGKSIPPENRGELERGDLLFFSSTPDGRIGHVAVYDADGKYIHSSGRVKTNEMSDSDPDFSARCYRGASRIAGMIPSEGIWQVIDHPWYFNR